MKKVLIIILSALALLSIIGIIIFSSCKCKNKPKEQVYRVKFEGNSYIKTDDYLTLEKIINDTENKVVDLPTEIEGLKVKALGDKAFENAKLKKIIIPETVETIGVSCFANCSNLTDVVIETKTENGQEMGVKTIKSYAFSYCSKLENINLNSISTIQNNALYACLSIKSLTFSKEIKQVEQYAFAECAGLESINFAGSNVALGDYVLYNCKNLKNASFAMETVASYGVGMLQGCTNLETLEVPRLDANNYSLSFFFGGNGYEQNQTFVPASLKNVIITSGGYLEENAFNNCSNIKAISIKNVRGIKATTFTGCTSIETIKLLDDALIIDKGAFVDTAFYKNQANWQNGLLYIGKNLVDSNNDVLSGDIEVKSGTTSIANNLFDNENITSVILPDSLNCINSGVFTSNCTNLKKVVVPFLGRDKDSNQSFGYLFGDSSNSLVPTSIKEIEVTQAKEIGQRAFKNLYGLEKLTLNKVEKIGMEAFLNLTSIQSISLQSGTWKIINDLNEQFEKEPTLQNLTQTYNGFSWILDKTA